ncbi:ferric reductase-like transmembrane domain-containing protein [Candidatus Wolfebacteria bacterium]|nr:ferric reductase-like transmembrane domain-containing protein [Candidatus Wolfebacteria bacterium]
MEYLISAKIPWIWYAIRASGLAGYIFLFLSTISGIGLYTGLSSKFLRSEKVLAIHKHISISAWAMILVHLIFLFFDQTLKLGIADLLVPFASQSAGINFALGIIGFYLFLFIIISSLFFRFKAPRLWRFLHYLSYPAFFIIFLHGVLIGTDTNEYLISEIYWITGIIASILTLYRIFYWKFEKEYEYIVKNIYKPTTDAIILEIGRNDGGDIFKFKSGQYVSISIPEDKKFFKKYRFSIASSPLNRQSFKLGIRILGDFTQKISKIKIGDRINVKGPRGDFVFNENKMENIVFIAGGIGITPFMSAFEYAADKNLSNKMALIYSNRSVAGALFLDEIQALSAKNVNFKPYFAITDEKLAGNEGCNFYQGFINEELLRKILNNQFSGKIFFLCGPPKFMEIMAGYLIKNGVKLKNIRKESFSL